MQTTSGRAPEPRRVAIVGAGPIGVEAALLFAKRGFDVTVYESGRGVGANVARWGHVRLFSPWALNRSAWGVEALREAGADLGDDDAFPTGAEYLEQYLLPLARHPELEGRIVTGARVTGIGRTHALKGDYIGDPARGEAPFLVATTGGNAATFDIVLDASGTYETPVSFGRAGLRVEGEAEHRDAIERHVPDPMGSERETYAGKKVLLIGAGHSAATTLAGLLALHEEEPGTEVVWLRRDDTPYMAIDDDPLPERRRLAMLANRAWAGEEEGVTPLGTGWVVRVEGADGGLVVTVLDAGGEYRHVECDRIVANVGYRPQTDITRELQVHHCYASEGPMKLAASLLAQSGNADCLAQESAGIDTLRSPEPNFFVIGAKSYGRNSNFLLRVGFEQIETIVSSLQ